MERNERDHFVGGIVLGVFGTIISELVTVAVLCHNWDVQHDKKNNEKKGDSHAAKIQEQRYLEKLRVNGL